MSTPTPAKLMLVSNEGEILSDNIEVKAESAKKRRKRYTMIYQERAATLAQDPNMSSAADWRVLWALLTHMPMRQSGNPTEANVWYGTHQELAELTGLNRVTVSKSLKKLGAIGVIEKVGHGKLAVHSEIASRGSGVRSIGKITTH